MPDPKHVAKLRASVEAWNAWRSAPASRGETPDLEGANLVGATLRKANLALANLRGADLREAELSGADLSGCDLRKAKLTGAILTDAVIRAANASEADLSGADLRRADLSDANLILTDLTAANLSGAHLRSASLSGADLGGSDLGGCNLDGADLGEVDLRASRLVQTSLVRTELAGADFRDAVAAGCSFGANDLSRSKGLDQMTHLGPSSVATTTLMLTAEGLGGDARRRAEIEVFLRGCGLEDHWLRQFGELIGHPAEFGVCFISHADSDRVFARALHDALQTRGIRCWIADRREGVQRLAGRTPRNRAGSAKLILCCSAAALRSDWLEKEIDAILEEERRLRKQGRTKPSVMVPVLLDDALLGWDNWRAPGIRDRVATDFAGWEHSRRLADGVDHLVRHLGSGPESGDAASSLTPRSASSSSIV